MVNGGSTYNRLIATAQNELEDVDAKGVSIKQVVLINLASLEFFKSYLIALKVNAGSRRRGFYIPFAA